MTPRNQAGISDDLKYIENFRTVFLWCVSYEIETHVDHLTMPVCTIGQSNYITISINYFQSFFALFKFKSLYMKLKIMILDYLLSVLQSALQKRQLHFQDPNLGFGKASPQLSIYSLNNTREINCSYWASISHLHKKKSSSTPQNLWK